MSLPRVSLPAGWLLAVLAAAPVRAGSVKVYPAPPKEDLSKAFTVKV